MYQPATARFKSPDPLPANGQPVLLGDSHYRYSRNDPVNRVDPSGFEDAPLDDDEQVTVIEIDGVEYRISNSTRRTAWGYGHGYSIGIDGIPEDAKAVFLALALQGAAYQQGKDVAWAVVSKLQQKRDLQEFTIGDYIGAALGEDPERLGRQGSLTATEQDALDEAKERFLEYSKALRDTEELFHQLGFDELKLAGRTDYVSPGGGISFPGPSASGKGFDTALEIVLLELPTPLSGDYPSIGREYPVEELVATYLFPVGKIARLARLDKIAVLSGKLALGAVRRATPGAIRAVIARVLNYAIDAAGRGGRFVINSVKESTEALLGAMGSAGKRGAAWLAKRLAAAAEYPASFYERLAIEATRNPNSRILVLGRGWQDSVRYTNVARHYGATYLKFDKWNNITKILSFEQIWNVNRAFLRQQIKAGKEIILSHDPSKAAGFFAREIQYLESLGYQFVQDGWIWRAIK